MDLFAYPIITNKQTNKQKNKQCNNEPRVVKVKLLVAEWCLTLFDPMDCTHQAPLSMGFFRQECWNGLLYPPPRDLPDPEIEPTSLMFPALTGGFFTTRESGASPVVLVVKN